MRLRGGGGGGNNHANSSDESVYKKKPIQIVTPPEGNKIPKKKSMHLKGKSRDSKKTDRNSDGVGSKSSNDREYYIAAQIVR